MLVGYENQQEVAREHRIGKGVVNMLIKKARCNPRFLEELISRRECKEAQKEQIADEITQMNEQGKILDSVAAVTKIL